MNQSIFQKTAALLAVTCAVIAGNLNAAGQVALTVDEKAFFSKQDMVWEQLPRQWNEGLFVGNGQLGIMFYRSWPENTIEFQLGRQDVTDHRKNPKKKTSISPYSHAIFDHCRLDIGRMRLTPAGKIQSGTARLSFYNAEGQMEIVTDKGSISLRVLSLRDRMVQLILLRSTEKDGNGNPLPWQWSFIPSKGDSPRVLIQPELAVQRKYLSNPPPVSCIEDGVHLTIQPLLAGGDYATGYREVVNAAQTGSVMYISTANEVPESGKSAAQAVADIRAAERIPQEMLIQKHRDWWNRFYRKTFLSIPDARLEAFYWAQMYKLASAWREDGPAIDLLGPWMRLTGWPSFWINLNLQLTYLPVYAANRLEIGQNYLDLMDTLQQTRAFYFGAKGKSVGDYAWLLHNYRQHLLFSGDDDRLIRKWCPMADVVIDGYLARLQKLDSGKLSLPQMSSPEYNGYSAVFNDTNYNLALLRWLLNARLDTLRLEPAGLSPEKIRKYREVLRDLIDYPVDENGLRIGSDQALDKSHRHFSHLLGLYPLHQFNVDMPAQRELLLRSLKHWHRIGNGKGLAGYSFTGGAALYASLGLGDEAVKMLNDYLDNKARGGRALPNTMYVEGRNPVIETPLHGAAALMDLLIQSHGGKIRIFPALPKHWRNAEFYHLRAAGAFTASAKVRDGKLLWAEIDSEKGAKCVVLSPLWSGLKLKTHPATPVRELAPGEYEVTLAAGCSVLLFPAGSTPDAVIAGELSTGGNPFGVKRGKELPPGMFYPHVPAVSQSSSAGSQVVNW